MKPVKIVYLINGLGSGGAEMMLLRLLERLDREKFAPEVVALLALDGPVETNIAALGIPVQVLKMKSKMDLAAVWRLAKYLQSSRPAILQTQLFAADIIGRTLGYILQIPVIISSIRNVTYGGRFRDLLLKWTDRFTMTTTFVSRQAAKRFIDQGITLPGKALVIYNGLDPTVFRVDLSLDEAVLLREAFGIPERKIFMLAVGSLTRQKGYDLLFEALAILNSSNKHYHLIIAGEGDQKRTLSDLACRLGIDSQVTFIGRSDEVNRLMAAADLLVLSSHWEGLPGVVIEAMASALPVVATDVGGTGELIIDGKTGYLVPPADPDRLAEALLKVLYLNVSERKLLGLAGMARVEQEFHVDKMVKAYENLYSDCIRKVT